MQVRINQISAKRDAFIKKNAGPKDSLDRKVMKSVAEQAADIGVAY